MRASLAPLDFRLRAPRAGKLQRKIPLLAGGASEPFVVLDVALRMKFDPPAMLPLPGMAKGQHVCDVRVADRFGAETIARLTFLVDPTARYTPVPRAWPAVKATAFC